MATLGVLAILAAAMSASAQTVEIDPLQCWWRTSAPAVRIGQAFSVVLTCTVVETDTVTVVPNQAPLDPMVMQMPPFEVLGGTHPADLRTDDHRFFQYEYRLRIVVEDAFGKDVKLPDTTVSYHLRSRGGDGPAIEGRELTYTLPPMSVRVVSLVPDTETDIRDASPGTFGDVESRTLRADLLRTVGGVLFALAGLGIVLAAVRLFGAYRAERTVETQMVPDVTILRHLGRELSVVGRERRAGSWTPALVDRLMTALRIAAAYALSRRVIQVPLVSTGGEAALPDRHVTESLNDSAKDFDGHLVVETGWIRPRTVAVGGLVTAETIRQHLSLPAASTVRLPALRSSEGKADTTSGSGTAQRFRFLEELEHALRRVTLKQYGREPRVEDDELDEALDVGARAVRRMTADHSWLGRKLAAVGRFRAPLRPRVWTR